MHHAVRNEARCVWAIAWPVILTNLLNATVGMVDFKMVGALGVVPIAAVGMARQVMMFLMVLMIAVTGGSSVLIAHAHGAGHAERVAEVSAKTISLMSLASLVLVMPAGLLFSRPLLLLLGAQPEVAGQGGAYLDILFSGTLFTMFNFAVTGILLGVGRTKVSLVLLIGINALNVVLNYVFIFGAGPIPALGVRGAALGTVAARALGSVAGLWIVTTPRLPIRVRLSDAFRVDLPLVRTILYLGGPRSLQGVVRNFSRLATLRIITLLPNPTRSVSAYSVGMQVRMISTFIGLAFMSAAMARVGQNLGRGDPDAAEKSGWISLALATSFMAVVAVLLALFPEAIMGFFTDDPSVIEMGRVFFLVIAFTEPVMASAFALSGALRGGGDPVAPFLYSAFSDIVVVIGAGYVLAVTLNLGFAGIAAGIALSAFTRAIPTVVRFRRGRWRSHRLA